MAVRRQPAGIDRGQAAPPLNAHLGMDRNELLAYHRNRRAGDFDAPAKGEEDP